jgi:hypothetical protein
MANSNDDAPAIQNPKSQIQNLLDRPAEQRIREYKYRFAQSTVFGLPVIGLQYFGLRLGGPEAAVWTGLFQAALAGWVLYIGAAGMLFEGLVRRRLSGDLFIAGAASVLYLFSAAGVVRLILLSDSHAAPASATGRLFFVHAAVILLIVWCGLQWWRGSSRGTGA